MCHTLSKDVFRQPHWPYFHFSILLSLIFVREMPVGFLHNNRMARDATQAFILKFTTTIATEHCSKPINREFQGDYNDYTTMSTSYYDVDAILAEEELIPCTTLFEFSHLQHLDPDASIGLSRKKKANYLPENSRIKLPMWAVEKWANLGFVRLQLPRHYGRKARQRLEADPGDADLRYVPQLCMEWVWNIHQ